MLQPLQLKYHLQTIGVHPSLSKNAIYEQKCLDIQKLYKQAGKCDNQQQLKDVLEDAMVSNPEEKNRQHYYISHESNTSQETKC